MNIKEADLMRMTPRKLFALLKVHYDIKAQINNASKKSKGNFGFIDNIPGW